MEHWYTFYTKPNSEKLVSQRLLDLELEVFFPQLKLKKAGRKNQRPNQISTEPLFPCYLFARVDLDVDSPSRLRWLPGVRGIVGTFDSPLVVPADIINGIRQKTAALNERVLHPVIPFKHGDQVRIVSGPFESLLATFDRPLPSLERVQILMEILGQVRRVKIDIADLKLEKKSGIHYTVGKRSRRTRGKGRIIKTTS